MSLSNLVVQKTLKVEAFETGSTFLIRFEGATNDPNIISKLKAQIQIFIPIPADDQILLIGPPFKRMDNSTVSLLFAVDTSSTIDQQSSNKQRIFIYDRRVFTDPNRIPIEYKILPISDGPPAIPQLAEQSKEISALSSKNVSPILNTLPGYERHLLANLKRGESYVGACDVIFNNSRKALDEYTVQLDSIYAAWSNLHDHYQAVKSQYEIVSEKLQLQQNSHYKLINNFESSLVRLKGVVLHPSLVTAMSNQSNNYCRSKDNASNPSSSLLSFDPSSSTAFSVISDVLNNLAVNKAAGRQQAITLLDCLSLEKEHAWHKQCVDVHGRIAISLEDLHKLFAHVRKGFESIKVPNSSNDQYAGVLTSNLSSMGDHIKEIQTYMETLRTDYTYVYEMIITLIDRLNSDSNNQQEIITSVASSLTTLENKKNTQESELFTAIDSSYKLIHSCKSKVSDVRNSFNKTLYSTMRSIASLQTDLFTLKKRLGDMNSYYKGDNVYFTHLDHLDKLPATYQALLEEIARRRAFTESFEGLISSASNKIAQFRSSETVLREDFIRNHGTAIPPIFYSIIPSLKEKPPYFTPSLTESQWLPEVAYDDINQVTLTIPSNADEVAGSIVFPAMKTTSCSSDDSSDVASLKERIALLEKENAMLKATLSTPILPALPVPATTRTASNEHVMTNMRQLQQTVSRLKGLMSAPHAESDEAELKGDDFLSISHNIQEIMTNCISALVQKEDSSNSTASSNSNTNNFTISFLDFNVGDVALFLPLQSKKPTYVAFHIRRPHRYLSAESLEIFLSNSGSSSPQPPVYVVGRIVFIEAYSATEETNPYSLTIGTQYFILHIEQLFSFGSNSSFSQD